MANPGSIIGAIGESFETIGQNVVRETAQAPKDIGQKAMESLGVSSGKTPKGQAKAAPATPEEAKADSVKQEEEAMKRAVARAALEELIGKKPKQKEPSVREKNEQEEAQKKELEKQKKELAAKSELPQPAAKRPRGDLYGVKAKKTSAERKMVRQD